MFNTEYKSINLIETSVLFDSPCGYAPVVFLYVEARDVNIPHIEFPYIKMPVYAISAVGFIFYHTKYDPDKFKIHYIVYGSEMVELERGEV